MTTQTLSSLLLKALIDFASLLKCSMEHFTQSAIGPREELHFVVLGLLFCYEFKMEPKNFVNHVMLVIVFVGHKYM